MFKLFPRSKHKYLLLLFFCLLIIPIQISKSCGPNDLGFYGYSFLNPKIIDLDSKYAAYFAGFEEVFKELHPRSNIQEKDNLQEWRERFCEIPNTKDLHYIIYKAPYMQVRALSNVIRRKEAVLPPYLAKNTFAAYLKKHQCTEAVNYLSFAKKCEPHVIATNGWETNNRDTIAMELLIKEGSRHFRKTKSHYFKLRYAYQLIRLAHYKKNYGQTLELYDYLMPKVDNAPSIIEDWILGHKAGALIGIGRNVEATYLYAKIFQNCPSKRASAYLSYKINSDEEWTDCLRLCQDDHERATLHAMRASAPNSKLVPEMEEIYLLDPENENLELLLVREIRRLEKDLLGLDFNKQKRQNKRYHNLPRKIAGQQVVDLQQLVRGIIREGKIHNLNLWRIADGYLELLAGDYYAAKKTLKNLQNTIENEALKEQLDAMLMVATIDGFEEANEDMEKTIVDYKRNPLFRKYPDFDNFTKDKLSYLFKKEGLVGKAFLYEHSLKDLKYNPQVEVIDNLLELCKKENRTRIEDALVLKENGTTIEYDLLDMKGVYYLSEYKLESALETLRKIPRKERDNYSLANPFRESFVDCINCNVVDTAAYNKVEVLEQLIEMEYKSKADEEKGAGYNYQIGVVLYNMSYFGHAWKLADNFRSGSSWNYLKSGEAIFETSSSYNGNRETVNCTLPLYYFDKAFRLARSPELAARAAFMAAKCEQNLYYTTKRSQYSTYSNDIPPVPDEYRSYFNLLIENYADTKFYEEVVQECLYFERYAARY